MNAARHELISYAPSGPGKLFAKRKKRQLESNLHDEENAHRAAVAIAQREYEHALRAWTDQSASIKQASELAIAVLQGNRLAYDAALEQLDPFSEFRELGGTTLSVVTDPSVTAFVTVLDDEVVPAESLSLTKSGKLSTRAMAKSKRLDAYQDFVCGAALRVGRELVAALPVPSVIVNVASPRRNTATGHLENMPILSVRVPRGVQQSVNWDHVDASDLVEELEHRMSFKKTKGFGRVELIEG